jgi:hypothetical protein
LGVVHGKQVVVFLNWAAGAWISLIAETIETVIAGSVFGILAAQQFAFPDAVIDFDVELVY